LLTSLENNTKPGRRLLENLQQTNQAYFLPAHASSPSSYPNLPFCFFVPNANALIASILPRFGLLIITHHPSRKALL
jgi:hypothetical protein